MSKGHQSGRRVFVPCLLSCKLQLHPLLKFSSTFLKRLRGVGAEPRRPFCVIIYSYSMFLHNSSINQNLKELHTEELVKLGLEHLTHKLVACVVGVDTLS